MSCRDGKAPGSIGVSSAQTRVVRGGATPAGFGAAHDARREARRRERVKVVVAMPWFAANSWEIQSLGTLAARGESQGSRKWASIRSVKAR